MHNTIAEIINQWDPAELFRCGCPNDEYETEIRMIEDALKSDIDADSLADRIMSIFTEMFGNSIRIEKVDCYKISVECLNSINNI